LSPIINKADSKFHLGNLSKGIKLRTDKEDSLEKLSKDEKNDLLSNIKDINRFLSDNDKKTIDKEMKELSNYLEDNPQATLKDIKNEEDKMNSKIQSIIEPAKNKKYLEKLAKKYNTKANDKKELAPFLSTSEKKKGYRKITRCFELA